MGRANLATILNELGGPGKAAVPPETIFFMSMSTALGKNFFDEQRTALLFAPDRLTVLRAVFAQLNEFGVLCLDALALDEGVEERVFDPEGTPLNIFSAMPDDHAPPVTVRTL